MKTSLRCKFGFCRLSKTVYEGPIKYDEKDYYWVTIKECPLCQKRHVTVFEEMISYVPPKTNQRRQTIQRLHKVT